MFSDDLQADGHLKITLGGAFFLDYLSDFLTGCRISS